MFAILHLASSNPRRPAPDYRTVVFCLALLLFSSCTKTQTESVSPTDLTAAIQSGSLRRIESLLQQGVSPNACDNKGELPLASAIWVKNTGALELLLKCGADPNLRNEEEGCPLRPLELAIGLGDAKLVELLVKSGAQVNGEFVGGVTPLMRAAKRPNLRIVQILLQAGADPLAIDDCGGGALMMARGNGSAEGEKVFQVILHAQEEALKARVNATNSPAADKVGPR